MRTPVVVGSLLVVVGILGTVFRWTLPEKHTLFELGELEASVTERREIPIWVGVAVTAAGVVLILGGMRARRS